MVKEKLDRKKHPFFGHAEAEYFIALDNRRQAVGRIAAIVDRRHNEIHRDRTGFFGLFECIKDEDTAAALFEAAGTWLKGKGLEAVRGPVNLSMNDECGLLIEGFDLPPVFMMPYNPPYYIDLLEKNAFFKARDLFAFLMDTSHGVSPKVREIVDRLRSSNEFSFRQPKRNELLEEALRIMEIYNQGWSNNWGFVPWTEAEMVHMAGMLIRLADLNIVLFAEHKGRTVGFAAALPNFNEILPRLNGKLFPLGIFKFLVLKRRIKGIRAIVFGVLPEYMRTGLAYLLYDEFEKAITARNYEWGELSWELEDNQAINRFAASIGAAVYKKYRIYEKNI